MGSKDIEKMIKKVKEERTSENASLTLTRANYMN